MIYQLPEAPPPPKLPPPPLKPPPPEKKPPDELPPPKKKPPGVRDIEARINPAKKPTTARITSAGNPNEKTEPKIGRIIALNMPLNNLPNELTASIKQNAIQKYIT